MKVPLTSNVPHAVRSAVLAALLSTTLVLSPPATKALPPLLDDVIVEATEASLKGETRNAEARCAR